MDYFADPNLCLICFGYHPLKYCKYFKTFTVQQRIYLVRVHRYCAQCFSRSHLLDECTLIDSCDKCHRPHHTMLHREAHASPYSPKRGPSREPRTLGSRFCDTYFSQREYHARHPAATCAQTGLNRTYSGPRVPHSSNFNRSMQREHEEQQPTSTSMEPPRAKPYRGDGVPNISFSDASYQMPSLPKSPSVGDREYERHQQFIPISTSSVCGDDIRAPTPSSQRSFYDLSYISSTTSRWLQGVQQTVVPPRGQHLYQQCCNDYSCPHMTQERSSRHWPTAPFHQQQRRHSMSRYHLASPHSEQSSDDSCGPGTQTSCSPAHSSAEIGSFGLSFSTRRSREPSFDSDWSGGDTFEDHLFSHTVRRARSPMKKRETVEPSHSGASSMKYSDEMDVTKRSYSRKRFIGQSCTDRRQISVEPSSRLRQHDEDQNGTDQREDTFLKPSAKKKRSADHIHGAGDLNTAECPVKLGGDEDQGAAETPSCDRTSDRTGDQESDRSCRPSTARSELSLKKRQPPKDSKIPSKKRRRFSIPDPSSSAQCIQTQSSEHLNKAPFKNEADHRDVLYSPPLIKCSPPTSSSLRATRRSEDSATSLSSGPIIQDSASQKIRNKPIDKSSKPPISSGSRSSKICRTQSPSIDSKKISVIRSNKRSRVAASDPSCSAQCSKQSQSSKHSEEPPSEADLTDPQINPSTPLTKRTHALSFKRRSTRNSLSHESTHAGSSSQPQPRHQTPSQQSAERHRTHQKQLHEIRTYLQQLLQHLKGPKEYWHTPANQRRQQLMRQQLYQLKCLLRQLIQDVASPQPRCRSPTCTCQQQESLKTLFQQLLPPLQQCGVVSSSRQLHSCIQQLIQHLQQRQCQTRPPVGSSNEHGFSDFLQQLRKLEQECQSSERGHRVELVQQRLRLQVILRQLLKAALEQLTEILNVVPE